MMTDRKRENADIRQRETLTDYLPQRDLPMPAYEFQIPNHSTGSLSTHVSDGVRRQASGPAGDLAELLRAMIPSAPDGAR